MALLRCVEIFLCVSVTSLAASLCPHGWYRYGEVCYFFIVNPVTWVQANTTCAHMHSTLAIPRSEKEQTFLWQTCIAIFAGQPDQLLWIGCNDIEQEGNWQPCFSGSSTHGYQNWDTGQPEINTRVENCALMSPVNSGRWHDYPCSDAYYAVCQQPTDAGSTPAYCLHAGPDGRISSRCLSGHVVKELPADGVLSCGKACRLEPRCQSFNLLDQGVRGESMTCQLSNLASYISNEGDRIEVENCYLFDI